MAVSVVVEGPDVVIRMDGWDAVWAIAKEVRIPLAQVETVDVVRRADVSLRGLLRWGGTGVPGLLYAGRFRNTRRREFWFVRRGAWVLVLCCVPGAPYDRVVVEVDDPHAALVAIRTPQRA